MIKDKISEAMKSAMRSQSRERLGVIRLIMAAFKQKEVDDKVEINDEIALQVLDKMVKQRRESIKQYLEASRSELADREEFEVTVLQEFLPAAATDEEVRIIVAEAVKEVGATTVRDMGRVMGILKPKLQGRADLGKVGNIVKDMLSN